MITMNGGLAKIYQDSVYYWDNLPDGKRIIRYHKTADGTNIFRIEDGSFVIWPDGKPYSFSAGQDVGKIYFMFNFKSDVIMRTEKRSFKLDLEQQQIVTLPWQMNNYVMEYDEKNDFFWNV